MHSVGSAVFLGQKEVAVGSWARFYREADAYRAADKKDAVLRARGSITLSREQRIRLTPTKPQKLQARPKFTHAQT